jgi:hypothetical protein
LVLGIGLAASCALPGEPVYSGANITGQLVLTRTVNATEAAQNALASRGMRMLGAARLAGEIPPEVLPKRLRPPLLQRLQIRMQGALQGPAMHSLGVEPGSADLGFSGISHFEQRQANRGNQFSVEPPSQGLAVANGFVVEGVNNAFQVYDMVGEPVLATVLSMNELFGVTPAIDRDTGVYGIYPTDIRVFYDHAVNRWFVLQRAQDYNMWGYPVSQSHLYLAVSQTGDPAGTYDIYTMDTTNWPNPGCPCVPDYPQIGADQHGFYVSVNEFNIFSSSFVDVRILAFAKAALASGEATPAAYQLLIKSNGGYGFTIQPAVTSPGAGYVSAQNGIQYFVSSNSTFAYDNRVAVWALANTATLATANPSPVLTMVLVPTLTYSMPDVATQPPGPLPYGESLSPPGRLAYLDGGDSRVLSVSHARSRLYVTLATQVSDENYRSLVGGAYVVLSTGFRGGTLSASVLGQGYLIVNNNHVLRPAVAVNARGSGAIVFTLVGPDYYPSAAFVPINTFSPAPAAQIAAAGELPEDGFTGYPEWGVQGVARWGDYAAAVVAGDGSIWMGTEYIPDAPRTELANWGTFLFRYVP